MLLIINIITSHINLKYETIKMDQTIKIISNAWIKLLHTSCSHNYLTMPVQTCLYIEIDRIVSDLLCDYIRLFKREK